MYLVGNWKMNMQRDAASGYVRDVLEAAAHTEALHNHNVVLCPPSVWLCDASVICKYGDVALGGQDCHHEGKGAYTGNVSASMLKEAGCQYVIVGHSERREYQCETDELVAAKLAAAYSAGLQPILCVGESLQQRDDGGYLEHISHQIKVALGQAKDKKVIVAYEPIWAIGTGRVPSNEDIAQVCDAILKQVQALGASDVSILYGGSVNAKNCADIYNIDSVEGVLVGGASIDLQQWTAIMKAATTQ